MNLGTNRLAERTEGKGGKALVNISTNIKPEYGALNDTSSSAAQTLRHKV